MSNFQKKYYYDFKSINNQTHTVEIWQDTFSVISSTKVIGAVDPFIVSLPSLENKFQPVRGTGADLNLFATSSLQYMDLYTAAIQEYQVRHYINGSLNWCGYLDTEIFSSDFSRQKNYNVAMTANDGFALLDRMTYLQSNGTKFTGISSHWDVIKFIIQKINLPITNIYVALSTSISGVTNAIDDTTFVNTYVMNSNFYDEDGESLTLREVLEGILKPYGAFIQQSGGNMYITDVNFIAGTDTVMKVYNGTTFVYSNSTTLSKNIGDLSTIKFMSSDQTLNTVPALNKQVIKYSPYIESEILDYTDLENDFNGLYNSYTFGIYPNQWEEQLYFNSNTWNNSGLGTFSKIEPVNENSVDEDYFLRYGGQYPDKGALPQNLSFTLKKSLPIINPSSAKIKINCKALARTIDNIYGDEVTNTFYQITLRCRLKIGNQQYFRTGDLSEGWISATDSRSLHLDFNNMDKGSTNTAHLANKIDNQWIDLKKNKIMNQEMTHFDYLIPLAGCTSFGELVFEIYDWNVGTTGNYDVVNNSIKEVRIKDLVISIVDGNGKEYTTNDNEYVGKINNQLKNEAPVIDLIQGTNTSGSPVERGSMLKVNGPVYAPIPDWVRGGVTDKIEKLLIRSFGSNYDNTTTELVVKTKLLPTNIGYLTYNLPAQISGKKYMPTALKNDYANNTSEITMQEIFADSATIN